MPRPAHWTCPSCREVLGRVTRDGALTTGPGVRVTVLPATAEESTTIIVVRCCGCGQQRPWDRRPPGLETKAAAG